MSIPVEDASGFPPYGVVLVDDELIEYSSRSKSVLTVASGQGWNGRGARGTNLRNPSNTGGQRGVSHKSGAAVEVYGYSNPVQSDIPAGGARVVGGPWGALSVAYPLAPDRFPVSVGPGVTVLIEGIRDDATTLTIDTTVQGGGLTGFQSSGYALLVSREFGITGGPAGGFGGMEVISYTGRSGNALTGVRRGASLQRPDASTLNLQAKVHARFISGGGLPRLEVPCLILPISAAGSAAGDYHDPIETGFSERVQVDSEWLRYDEIVRGQGGPGAGVYFVRSDPDVYDEVLNRINTYKAMAAQGGGGQQMQQPPGPGPNTPPPQPPGGAEWDHATLRNQMAGEIEFRGQDGTLDSEVGVAHADGIDFIPVFRTEGYSAGPGDLVTVMTPDGSVREGRRVVWARRAETRMMPAALGVTDDAAYVGLNANVARRVVSTTRPIAQRRPGVHLPTAINFDTQGTARIIKAPSGEMPYTRDFNLVVGGTFGGVHAACWVDDVGTAALNTPQVWHRVDVPGTGDRFFPSDAKEIRLRRDSLWGGWGSEPALVRRRPANPGQPPGQGQPQNQVMTETGKVRAADRGRPAVTFSKREGEPWVRATLVQGRTFPNRPGQDDRDCGLIQMGAELIAYRGLEDRGAEGTMVLKDLIRGFMGTEAAPHYDGEEATFLTWMETALVKGGVDGASFNIPVENTFGFPQQGMGAFLDKIGHVTEIFSYTRTAQGEFQMPRGVDGQTQGERGIFRARYGTVAAAHEPGDLILRIPFRYWDRAAERTDDPNLGYYQFPIQVGESFFQSLTWSEKLPQSHLRLRLLARVDARASWGDEPSGSSGLYEFRKPQDESNANRIGMQGDSIEVRAYFEYEPGAFQPDFTSDSWKETPVLESVSMQYFAPNRVLSSVR
jgi:hypothetical protein